MGGWVATQWGVLIFSRFSRFWEPFTSWTMVNLIRVQSCKLLYVLQHLWIKDAVCPHLACFCISKHLRMLVVVLLFSMSCLFVEALMDSPVKWTPQELQQLCNFPSLVGKGCKIYGIVLSHMFVLRRIIRASASSWAVPAATERDWVPA